MPLRLLTKSVLEIVCFNGCDGRVRPAAARLLPGAEIAVEPRLVTELIPADPGDVLACGPEPMLEALRTRVPGAQLAWEAPMACGYGACYGCVVEIDGHYRRLCVDGPVLRQAA